MKRMSDFEILISLREETLANLDQDVEDWKRRITDMVTSSYMDMTIAHNLPSMAVNLAEAVTKRNQLKADLEIMKEVFKYVNKE